MADTNKRALVSVSDKTGLAEFIGGLVELGFEIVSTGGTRKHLEEAGIPVINISEYTSFPEIMDGRVKTLHPKVHGAILGCPDVPHHAEAIAEHGIIPFQLVVCNLYPFEETVAKPGVTIEEAIEQIDIGGPSMVRSAAKNHKYVGIVTHPEQYTRVLEELNNGELTPEFRRHLAISAFEMTARYDAAITEYFHSQQSDSTELPVRLTVNLPEEMTLRYGENPHQNAALYTDPNADDGSIAKAEQLNGKELSYNNLLDLDAALALVREFEPPTVAILKHNNPCGCGTADKLADAFEKAYSGDPVSAFGSIIGINRPVDLATAEQMCEPGRFIEAIIAPDFDADAFEMLTTKPKWKNNVRLMKCPGMIRPANAMLDFRCVNGGVLVQQRDTHPDPQDEWKVVTERQPTDAELADLKFSWLVCKHVKSNAIVYAKDGCIVGVGAGQMSRLDSAYIAAYKSGERSKGGVVASDAFFPFRDGIDQAAEVGITAAIQPGGSRNDDEVITACNEHGIAMLFTGRRHFKH